MVVITCMCADSGDSAARICGLTNVAADGRLLVVGSTALFEAIANARFYSLR